MVFLIWFKSFIEMFVGRMGRGVVLIWRNGRLASYSPCVEQAQKCIAALQRANNFHSIQTYEFRLREYYVDEAQFTSPPMEKRPRLEPNAMHHLEYVHNNNNNDNTNNNNNNNNAKQENENHNNNDDNDDDEKTKNEDTNHNDSIPTTKEMICTRPFPT